MVHVTWSSGFGCLRRSSSSRRHEKQSKKKKTEAREREQIEGEEGKAGREGREMVHAGRGRGGLDGDGFGSSGARVPRRHPGGCRGEAITAAVTSSSAAAASTTWAAVRRQAFGVAAPAR